MAEQYCIYNDREYTVIVPQPDSNTLAKKGDRLMLLHKYNAEPRFCEAPKGILHHGIAIGLFEPDG